MTEGGRGWFLISIPTVIVGSSKMALVLRCCGSSCKQRESVNLCVFFRPVNQCGYIRAMREREEKGPWKTSRVLYHSTLSFHSEEI